MSKKAFIDCLQTAVLVFVPNPCASRVVVHADVSGSVLTQPCALPISLCI